MDLTKLAPIGQDSVSLDWSPGALTNPGSPRAGEHCLRAEQAATNPMQAKTSVMAGESPAAKWSPGAVEGVATLDAGLCTVVREGGFSRNGQAARHVDGRAETTVRFGRAG